MDSTTAGLIVCVAAYAVGSLPFGYLTAKTVAGKDIRQHGSGNIGATNVIRVLGVKWGVLVLLLDCLKGLLPVLLLPPLVAWAAESPEYNHLKVACGVAAILGHVFPCWLGLRGGKGVATALGVVCVLAPRATLAAIAVFAVCLLAFRIVSLGSLLAAMAFAACQMVLMQPDPFSAENWSLATFSLAIPLLIVYRHRGNLARLLRGEEPRFRWRSRDGDNRDSQ